MAISQESELPGVRVWLVHQANTLQDGDPLRALIACLESTKIQLRDRLVKCALKG